MVDRAFPPDSLSCQNVMTWDASMFTGITDEVVSILPVVIPAALTVYAISLALRFARKVLGLFS